MTNQFQPWVQPKEPNATTALILGIVALAGGMVCYLPMVCGPVALVIGLRSLKAIREQPHLGGHGEALTGFLLGLFATIFLVLMLVVIAGLIWAAIYYPEFYEE